MIFDGIATLFVAMFVISLILLCMMHYEGPINICRKIGLWWLRCADKMEERYEQEDKEIYIELGKLKLRK